MGDVNSDDVPDFAVGASLNIVGTEFSAGEVFVYSGADRSLLFTLRSPVPLRGTEFGNAVASVGDITGDGVPDLVVGALGGPRNGEGIAFLFSGADGSWLDTLNSPVGLQPEGTFAGCGRSVAGVGDIDGDSVPDLLVGAPEENQCQGGRAFVFSGADRSTLLIVDNPAPPGGLFGLTAAGVGDVNGDAKPDFVVGAPFKTVGGNGAQGRVFVFSGADGRLLRTLDDPNPQAGGFFGWGLAAVGDLNGDGIPELLLGAPSQSFGPTPGRAYIFSAADGSLLATLDHPNSQAGAIFGRGVAGAGDVNNDGVPDLLVSADFEDVGDNANQGRAYVFSGAGWSLLATLDHPNPQAGALFGFLSIAGMGDLDDDGKSDLLVGAPFQSVGELQNVGQAFLFLSGNQPPVADAGPDQVVECSGHGGTPVTLNGSGSSDPDDDTLSFTWKDGGGNVLGTTAVLSLTLPLGQHAFTLRVADGKGGTASDSVIVTVRDTTPPTLSFTLSPGVLWPPDHKLAQVNATIQLSDICDPSPQVELVSITSNEPDNGLGEGDTPNDIQEAAFGTDDRSVLLRAERSGTGSGRVYTMRYVARDASGNVNSSTAQVVVPHGRP